MSTPRRAIIYTRVSLGMQVENTSLEMQEKACKRKAADMQAPVVEVFTDPGVSGTKYLTRPGIQGALSALRAGQADSLIIYKLDRAGRDVDIIRKIRKEVLRAGCDLIFADGMNFENNATGNLMFTQLAGFAEFEREMIRERTMNGRKALAESGVQPSRSQSPYGYRIVTKRDKIEGLYPDQRAGDYVVIEEQARWVGDIFRLFAAGWSLRSIAKHLDESGVPTPKGGKQWRMTTVSVLLFNPIYSGRVVYGRTLILSDENMTFQNDPTRLVKDGRRCLARKAQEWVEVASIPALIDAETWERCAEKLAQSKEEKQAMNGGNPDRKYMLSGLVVCPSCGWRIGGQTNKTTKRRTYRCDTEQGCIALRRTYPADLLEEMLLKALMYLHNQPHSIRDALISYDAFQREQKAGSEHEKERIRLNHSLRQVQADLDHMKAVMIEGMRNGLAAADFASDLKALSERRERIETKLQALAPVEWKIDFKKPLSDAEKLTAVASAIVKVFEASPEDFSPAEKRALLLPIVERIVPNENGGALVVWKGGTAHNVLTYWNTFGSISSRYSIACK